MKYVRIAFCATIVLFAINNANVYAGESAKIDVTTIYLVRHAEKEHKGEKNPQLTEQGKQRAKLFADMLTKVNIDAVYSTDTIRTRDTAKPIANSKGKEVIIYDARGIDYAQFVKNNLNKTVFVVGHSNTIPSFVNALLGSEKYQDLDESNYNSLFIVDVIGEKKVGKLLTVDPF